MQTTNNNTNSRDVRLDDISRRILTADSMASLRAPIEAAHALPNAAYFDPEFLELENARLFAPTWVLAGFGGATPNAGDGMPVTIAGVPVILVRGNDDQMRGFQNVCPHRGSRLLSEPCSGKSLLTCPYHSWAFDTEGALRNRPHFNGPEQHQVIKDGSGPNLIPVRTEMWHDFVFVNISGDAPPLADFLDPMAGRLDGYDMSTIRYAGSASYEVEANWKFAVENYIEPYHVFSLHPRLLNYAPMAVREPSKLDGYCFYNEYTVPKMEEGRGEGLPHWPDIPEEWKRRGLWFHLFPTFSVEVYADQFTVFHIIPTGPDTTREELHFYMIGDAATADEHADGRKAITDMWHDLNLEDLGVLKRLQQGRQAPGYEGGSFSPYWDEAPLAFSRLVGETLAVEDNP
jgi:choline monooxygenase